jgi:acyl-CoA thioester hydrolase
MEGFEYYERKINYYETDKMGIVHHSNYARFLEEARIELMSFYGLPYPELEDRGYMIPVLELNSRFLESVKYGETIKIVVNIDRVTSAKFVFSYKVYDESMKVIKHTASSVHCLLDSNYRPVAIKKMPEDIRDRINYMVEAHQKFMMSAQADE